MQIVIQQILNSLSIGSVYAMVAVGLTLIFGVLEVLSFAHGEYFMLGAYILYVIFRQLGIPYLIAIVLATLISMLIGWITRKTLDLKPGKSFENMILLTLGVSIILQNSALAIWGVTQRAIGTGISDASREFFGAVISDQRLFVLALTLLIFIFLDYFIRRTKHGKAMRAVAQNQEAAAVVGINIVRISSLTVSIGIGLAGLSGALIAPIISINPLMGLSYLMRCFAIITMAGKGNVRGAIVSSFALALIETLGTQYLGLAFKDIFAFLALILVLVIKPEGLFGRRAGLE